MAETSLPVSPATLERLREPARWAGVSVDAALDQAVQELYDRKFWDVVNAGYAALRADPGAWAEVEAERKAWDGTLLDGLDASEEWGEDRQVIPPPEQGPAP